MYAYVHWVLIQAVPFALFIDLLRLQTRFVHFVLFGGLTVYAGGYNVFANLIRIYILLDGFTVYAVGM